MNLPTVIQRPTPNYSPVPIQHNLLIAHMMEGGYPGSVAWLCQPSAKASAHICMNDDGSEVSQLVPLGMKAWAEVNFNGTGVSLEIPGFTAQGVPESRWRAAASIFGWLSLAYDIPPVWAKYGLGRGICQHHDLGIAGGGHVDCSEVGSPVWLAFIGMVQTARDEFAKAPLPPFLLHGLPNPHQTQLPPDAAPTASHGGAARVAPDEIPTPHPTMSTFPHGSVADLQWRLNETGAGLKVDGFAGVLTREAIRKFQITHGLTGDGLLGPMTWGALNRVTT